MKVFIQQPVIPAYRVPLFNALAGISDCEIEVHASEKVSGLPSSADSSGFKFKFIEHPCEMKLAGKAYHQKEMHLPNGYGPGDVVVYNSNARFISNMKLVKQAKKAGCRIIAWNHADSSTSGGIKSWIRKKLTASDADDLLLYTEYEKEQMIDQGWNEKNVFFLNNTQNQNEVLKAVSAFSGTEDILTAKKSESVQKFKNDNDLQDKKIFLYCGRITEKSQIDILLEAIADVDESKLESMKFIIIGDGDARKAIQQKGEDAGLNCINWLGAVYGEDNLAPWFLSADYLIYPGAIGLSLNHAMSYGLPVITHDDRKNQMPEFAYLKENENGLTYQHGSKNALRKLIVSAEINPEKLSGNAVKAMYDDITFEKMVNRFADCLKKKSPK